MIQEKFGLYYNFHLNCIIKFADEEACGEEILPQRPLEEMQEEDLEQPDDMNGEIEEEEVGQAAEARVREIVLDRNFKRIKFVIRETM